MGKYSNYKHVCYAALNRSGHYEYWQGYLTMPNGKQWNKLCKTEREAAIAVDIKLIELGREPVNILKRKQL